MQVRRASSDDLQEISSLWRGLARYHEPQSKYFKLAPGARRKFTSYVRRSMKRKDVSVFVAQKNSKLVGYLIAKIKEEKPVFKLRKRGTITDLFVEKGYRRQGIGRKLVKKALAWFRNRNLQFVEISVYVKNISGKIAWKRMGFEDHMTLMRRKLR